jgi:hypothetical protein
VGSAHRGDLIKSNISWDLVHRRAMDNIFRWWREEWSPGVQEVTGGAAGLADRGWDRAYDTSVVLEHNPDLWHS